MDEINEERPKPRRTRADALRNREQILRATVDLLIEQGPNVPLEMIARRAKVGIATLYRHFPDRTVLLRQVGLDLLRQAVTAAETALAEEQDAFTALARYMHDAIDLRISAVMPMLAEQFPTDEELDTARNRSRQVMDMLVRTAHEEESLRPDVSTGDIGMLIIRLTTPLPGGMSPEDNRRLSHRHVELLLDGMLQFMAVDSLPGPVLTFEELRAMGQGHRLPPPSQVGRRVNGHA
jgi:AcrR family transcriptional regulator